jgi:hypothetical protein
MNIHWLQNPIETIPSSSRPLALYKVENAICTSAKSLYYPNILLQTNNKLYLPINERFMSFNKKTCYEEQGMKLTEPLPTISNTTLEETPVYFFVYNVENYYHFIYDTLPYLWFYFRLKETIPNLKLLTQLPTPKHKLMFKFVQETFTLLDINYILLDPNTLYKTIYVSTSMTHGDFSNEPPNPQAWDVWNRLVVCAMKQPCTIECHKKMYISRRTHLNSDNSNIGTNYTQRRKMLNEDALVEKLAQVGYIEVFPEQWSMTNKIHAFQNTSHVVGAIGGGLCNLLFSKPSTHSAIIVSPFFMNINERFKYSMDHTCTHYCYDTSLQTFPSSTLAKYMRVKICKGPLQGVYGEIEDYNENILKVNLGDDTSVSLTSEHTQSAFVRKEDVEVIDRGLNSPFLVETVEIEKVV